jgi:hypothetical protein
MNAKCELHLVKRSGGLEVHEDLCEIVAKHSLVVKLAVIFAGYLNLSGRISHYNRLVNIWNMVTDPFEHRSTKFMLLWITQNSINRAMRLLQCTFCKCLQLMIR